METAPTQDVNKYGTDDVHKTEQKEDESEILDSGHSRIESRHRKKKRHRHRSRSSNAETTPESGNANEGASCGHDGDNETGEDSSGNNENVVVSSSTRKRRSKGSSRHRKQSSKDFVSGEDSGLSLGNSLNESMVIGDISHVTHSKENESANRVDGNTENGSQNDVRTLDFDNREKEESKHDSNKQGIGSEESKEGTGAILPNSKVNDESITDANALTTTEGQITHQHVLNKTEPKAVNESKKTDRIQRRLERQKTQYRLEKEMLKQRLDDTKTKFKEEITKYEKDLSDHRREYLKELSSLQLQEQYESLSLRIEDVGQLEEELDKRFKDCIEQQTDIEEMERFLNMREELCKSKERDIKKLDDELDAWQDELDIKRRQLEIADTSRRTGASLNTSYTSKPTTDEEDYILKKNLLKCQADLARSEEENSTLHKQLDALKKQFDEAHIQTRNHEKKIKQLERQLVIALSQLGSQKPNNLNQNSLPPINGHRPSIASSSAESRVDEIQREMRSRRHVGKDHLSINQEAALRRKLSGKDSGVSTRSPSSTRISTRTPSTSRRDQSLNEGTGGRSNASGSAGGSQSGEEGCQRQCTDATGVGTSPTKSSVSSKTEKSSVCVVM